MPREAHVDTTTTERPKAATNHGWPRNPGMELDLGLVEAQRVNLSAGERRVASLPGRRTVKKDAQAAWLLKAVTCIDLTTLSGDVVCAGYAPRRPTRSGRTCSTPWGWVTGD